MTRWLVAAAFLAGCSPSAEEVQAEFEDYVRGATACETAAECAIAHASCPLGCWVVVRADRVEDVERRARQLIEDYESGGQRCDYDCTEDPVPACIDEHCAAGVVEVP
jgi:hypothetical protein